MGDMTRYHREYYHKRRAKMIEFLGGLCSQCGSDDRLEFDHIFPGMKRVDIGTNYTLSNPLIQDELASRCQLLCYTCHREKTARENTGFTHGTLHAFQHKKCACDVCLEARARHNARRRKEASGT